MRLTRTAAPSIGTELLDAARNQCRIDGTYEDGILVDLIAAAVDYLDGPTGLLGRAIVTQTWRLELAAWPEPLRLPVEPVQSVAVSYINALGSTVTVDAANHYLVTTPGMASEFNWAAGITLPVVSTTTPFPVIIDMTCGFGALGAVPAALRRAILLLVSHWYDNRGMLGDGRGELPMTVSALLARYRRVL